MPYNHKKTIDIDELLNTLIKRGLIIEDEYKAKSFLNNISYYRFGFYSFYFRKMEKICINERYKWQRTDMFHKDVTFENIYELYNFDKKLRLILLDGIENIENILKSQIILNAGKENSLALYDNLDKKKNTQAILNDIPKKSFNNTYLLQCYCKHFDITINQAKQKKYKEMIIKSNLKLEIWKIMEVLTFGEVKKIFTELESETKEKIIKSLTKNTPSKISIKVFSSWIESIRHVRNISAHFSHIWRNQRVPKYTTFPTFFEEFIKLKDTKELYEIKHYSSLYQISVLIWYMLKNNNYDSTWNIRFQKIMKSFPQNFPDSIQDEISLKKMGFPDDWEKEDFWKNQTEDVSTYNFTDQVQRA